MNVRLSFESALNLSKHDNPLEAGFLAEAINSRLNQNVVHYTQYQILRLTPFSAPLSIPASLLSDVLGRVLKIKSHSIAELRLESINSFKLPLPCLLTIIEAIRKQMPDISIRGVTAKHILDYGKLENLSLTSVLDSLRVAGLSTLDGKGAGPYSGEYRHPLGLRLIPPDAWEEVHRTAHGLGLPSEAALMYGFGESWQDRLKFLEMIRAIQDETKGFSRFVLMPYQLRHDDHQISKRETNIDDLKMIAVARQFLDNFLNISLPWNRFGLEFSQLGLMFGANELQGAFFPQKTKIPLTKLTRAIDRTSLISLIQRATYRATAAGDKPTEGSNTNKTADQEPSTIVLYKVENHTQLSAKEISGLVHTATSLQLAHCSQIVRSHMKATESTLFQPAVIVYPSDLQGDDRELARKVEQWTLALDQSPNKNVVLELSFPYTGDNPTSLKDICEACSSILNRSPDASFVVRGLKAIWNLARQEKRSFEEILGMFKALNTVIIESSSYESEMDLTPSEIKKIHLAIHHSDIVSTGKAEIQASFVGQTGVLWQGFLQRLEDLRQIQNDTQGLVAVKIEPHPLLTLAEFLRGLSIGRIYLDNIPNIVTPILFMPMIHKRLTAPHTAMACVAMTTFLFGANDLDLANQELTSALTAESKMVGHPLAIRDARFYDVRLL